MLSRLVSSLYHVCQRFDMGEKTDYKQDQSPDRYGASLNSFFTCLIKRKQLNARKTKQNVFFQIKNKNPKE